MQKLALDTGAVSRWPALCADIRTYTMPKMPTTSTLIHPQRDSNETIDVMNFVVLFLNGALMKN
jgi:hypothetical protein